MLYQFSFKNFKSYKDEVVFDMRAENIGEFEDSLIIDKNGEKLLPVSVIYGPNAGGKSRFDRSFSMLNFYSIKA